MFKINQVKEKLKLMLMEYGIQIFGGALLMGIAVSFNAILVFLIGLSITVFGLKRLIKTLKSNSRVGE